MYSHQPFLFLAQGEVSPASFHPLLTLGQIILLCILSLGICVIQSKVEIGEMAVQHQGEGLELSCQIPLPQWQVHGDSVELHMLLHVNNEGF